MPASGRRCSASFPTCRRYVKSNFIDVIFVALPIRHIRRVLDLIDELRDTTASIYYIPDILVFDLIQSRTLEILGIPVIAMCETPFAGYRGVVKRLTDIVLCMAAMPLLLPLMAVISVAVKVTSPGPAIFRQRRYGLDGRPIVVYKFRTMDVDRRRRRHRPGHQGRRARHPGRALSAGAIRSTSSRSFSTCCRAA